MERKPQLLVCYLCGQQFGSSSLAIHQPQCYQKQMVWWKQGDPGTRGPKPKDPAVHGHKNQGQMSQGEIQKFNDENFENFNENLSQCHNCGRKFLPDRLQVHLRSCREGASGGGSKPVKGKPPQSQSHSSRSGSGSGSHNINNPRVASPSGRPKGVKPSMLVCYLCGSQFGSSSLTIHQTQCYVKQLVWWERADPATRGPKPKDPATHGPTPQDIENMKTNKDAFNNDQFKDYNDNLSPCPNCGRTFLADRLVVHMKSCDPGASGGGSKPVKKAPISPPPPRGQSQAPPPKASPGAGSPSRRSPLMNRLPHDGEAETRSCTGCGVLEYDPEAKFCQECGENLPEPQPKDLPLVCNKCSAEWDNGHFCQSCGGELVRKEKANDEQRDVSKCSCGTIVKPTSKFCDECGTAVNTSENGSGNSKRSPLTNRIPSNGAIEAQEVQESPAGEKKWMGESQTPKELPAVEEFETVQLAPCSKCGRSFNVDRIEKHVAICDGGKKRKVFDSKKNRVEGTESAQYQGKSSSTVQKQKSNWQSKSNAFREALQSAKNVDTALKEGKALPPPTYTREEDDTRTPCPHCGRKFASDVAERHIPKCANTVHKAKAPPKRPSGPSPPSFNSTAASGASVPEDVARMGVSPEKWQSIQAKKEDEWSRAFGDGPKDLTPCPHCNRNFVPKSLEIHLRSCGGRHGTSKKLKR